MKKKPELVRKSQPFMIGGFAGCIATTVIQPIDMIKVRLQILGESATGSNISSTTAGKIVSKNPLHVARDIIKKDGFLSMYKGLDAGIIRQLTYTTARMGLFRVFSDMMIKNQNNFNNKNNNENTALPLYKKALCGLTAGGLASLVGNPFDLSLIRLQADNTLPIAQRRNYKGVFDALKRTYKDDGLLGLWKGSTPTVLRAMSLNMAMLASYDQAKEQLSSVISNKPLLVNILASGISGFFAVCFSLPFDFVKTTLQRMQPDPITKQLPYKSFLDCCVQIFKNKGPLAFYTGFPTYYFRIAPHAMITLIVVDSANNQINSMYQ